MALARSPKLASTTIYKKLPHSLIVFLCFLLLLSFLPFFFIHFSFLSVRAFCCHFVLLVFVSWFTCISFLSPLFLSFFNKTSIWQRLQMRKFTNKSDFNHDAHFNFVFSLPVSLEAIESHCLIMEISTSFFLSFSFLFPLNEKWKFQQLNLNWFLKLFRLLIGLTRGCCCCCGWTFNYCHSFPLTLFNVCLFCFGMFWKKYFVVVVLFFVAFSQERLCAFSFHFTSLQTLPHFSGVLSDSLSQFWCVCTVCLSASSYFLSLFLSLNLFVFTWMSSLHSPWQVSLTLILSCEFSLTFRLSVVEVIVRR